MRDGFFRLALYVILGVFISLAGLIVVPIALRWSQLNEATARPYPSRAGTWWLVSLPSWARWWDNPVDGACGDQRGDWDAWCRKWLRRPATAYLSMFIWLAIRNPANYWSRIVTGVDELYGRYQVVRFGRYWSLSALTTPSGRVYPLFAFWKPLIGDRGLEIRIGWKIDNDVITPDMPLPDRCRGSVFRIQVFAKG